MSGRKMHVDKPAPSCVHHPGIAAIPGSKPPVCSSCDHYAKLAPKVMGTEKKAAPKK